MVKMAMINENVILIDPIVRFRSDIAQHTTMFHQALNKLTIIHTTCNYRQYPGQLFPEKSDIEPDQKYLKENDEEDFIDFLNPISWHKAMKRRNNSCA
jgi:hypothetical protein